MRITVHLKKAYAEIAENPPLISKDKNRDLQESAKATLEKCIQTYAGNVLGVGPDILPTTRSLAITRLKLTTKSLNGDTIGIEELEASCDSYISSLSNLTDEPPQSSSILTKF